jgi:MFS family permease
MASSFMSMALWGTVVGAIFGGGPTEKYGRKKVLILIGFLFTHILHRLSWWQ